MNTIIEYQNDTLVYSSDKQIRNKYKYSLILHFPIIVA